MKICIFSSFSPTTVSFVTITSVCPSVCLSVRLSVRLSICLSVCLSVRPSVCPSVYLSVCLSVRLFICLSICLSVRPSVHLSVCLSVRLSDCLQHVHVFCGQTVNFCRVYIYRGNRLPIYRTVFKPSRIPGLANCVNRLCKKSSVYSHLKVIVCNSVKH